MIHLHSMRNGIFKTNVYKFFGYEILELYKAATPIIN